ncbi:MAG: HD domain-containing protein [Dehalococcoidales bacterium]|nr:HD domain-containing protein [Dehalococcoidales bacterium]
MEDRATILLIGEYTDLDFLKELPGLSKYRVIHFEFSDTLPDRIRKASPGLVIIDTMSQAAAGLDLIRDIKENSKGNFIPVIMITPYENEEYRQKALIAGVDDFLMSPINDTELQARVGNLLKIRAFDRDIEAEVNRRIQDLTLAFEKVKITSLDTVYRLSRAAEYRDDDVGAHIERMSHYATAIARGMNLEEGFIENILWAAPMHDVGKIGIPDSVLLKPGKLTDEEWAIMRQHTTIGGEILKDSSTDFIRLAEEIALSHHEKWDGSGYPRGLRGNDIPLAGRIVALADVFDALTTERPYKRPFTVKESMDIIRGSSGSHFDPEVTEAFFSIEDEIVKEYNFWQFMEADTDSEEGEIDLSDLFGD